MLRAADRVGRVSGDDLTGNQPVEQHADGSQVLLDRRSLEIRAKRLDIGRDVQRLDVGELADMVMLAHQAKNRPTACRYTMPVYVSRIVAAKSTRKRRAAWLPASAMTRGTI